MFKTYTFTSGLLIQLFFCFVFLILSNITVLELSVVR